MSVQGQRVADGVVSMLCVEGVGGAPVRQLLPLLYSNAVIHVHTRLSVSYQLILY